MRSTFAARSSLRSPQPAFTLIEVLVVVAIIAMLAAVLLPSLSRARSRARILACRANMHGLGTSFQMYADAHRAYFPITKGSGDDNFFSLWKGQLLRNVNTLICPASRNVIRPETLRYSVAYSNDSFSVPIPYLKNGGDVADICKKAPLGRDDPTGGHSYEYNGCYDGESSRLPHYKEHKRANQFVLPLGQISLLHENDDKRDDLGSIKDMGCSPSKNNNGNNCPQPWDNHGIEGMNMLFADGHAEWCKKLAGMWNDLISSDPKRMAPTPTFSISASIDQIMARSQNPWNYFHR